MCLLVFIPAYSLKAPVVGEGGGGGEIRSYVKFW